MEKNSVKVMNTVLDYEFCKFNSGLYSSGNVIFMYLFLSYTFDTCRMCLTLTIESIEYTINK